MPTRSSTLPDGHSTNKENDKQFLVKQWQIIFNTPPPSGLQTNLLKKIIGWQQQAQKQGDLSAKERKLLLGDTSKAISNQPIGSQLIRVWKDETHHVTVLDKGYLYQGTHWKSLSAISKQITGTPWSGPAFFGLKK